jgi:hypothetical protein
MPSAAVPGQYSTIGTIFGLTVVAGHYLKTVVGKVAVAKLHVNIYVLFKVLITISLHLK